MVLVEVCTDNLADTIEAIRLGADRIELCSDLAADGLSPSMDLLREALTVGERHGVAIFPMVRCRAGDFVYSQSEQDLMIQQAVSFINAGATGIVIGALDCNNRVDIEFMKRIGSEIGKIDRAIDVTFHKAIDAVQILPHERFADVVATLEPYCSRVLTSGGLSTALGGASNIRELADRNRNPRPLAAGKIRADNAQQVVQACGVNEVHSRSPQVAVVLGKSKRDI